MTKRPLSPHLQIYKPQITSVLSILHRATGIGLATAIIAILIWIYALSCGPETYYIHQHFYHSTLGKLMLIGWLSCFYYHLCNGIRHLAWDCGWGFDLATVTRSGFSVLAVVFVLITLTVLILF